MSLFDTIADTAMKKLKKHMIEKKISAYIAKVNDQGEIETEPIRDGFVVIPESDFLAMKKIIFNLTNKTT